MGSTISWLTVMPGLGTLSNQSSSSIIIEVESAFTHSLISNLKSSNDVPLLAITWKSTCPEASNDSSILFGSETV